MVKQLRFHASNAEGMGLIPGWGTKIPHAEWWGQKKKKDRERERERKQAKCPTTRDGESVTAPQLWNSRCNSGQLNWAGLHTKGASLRYRSRSGQQAQQASTSAKEGCGERTVE